MATTRNMLDCRCTQGAPALALGDSKSAGMFFGEVSL